MKLTFFRSYLLFFLLYLLSSLFSLISLFSLCLSLLLLFQPRHQMLPHPFIARAYASLSVR